MIKVKITAMRRTEYPDLMEKYENPIEHTCDVQVGDVFWADSLTPPEGLCESAWQSLLPFVKVLLEGGGNFFDGWMKNPRSAMLSCNDGFRPVSFLIEAVEE